MVRKRPVRKDEDNPSTNDESKPPMVRKRPVQKDENNPSINDESKPPMVWKRPVQKDEDNFSTIKSKIKKPAVSKTSPKLTNFDSVKASGSDTGTKNILNKGKGRAFDDLDSTSKVKLFINIAISIFSSIYI